MVHIFNCFIAYEILNKIIASKLCSVFITFSASHKGGGGA